MTATEPTFAPAPGHTPEVEYAVTHRIGRVHLNRPRAINSLTGEMVASMLFQLDAWADDDGVGAVFLDGAGEKGLCAGGDVRQMRELLLAGDPDAVVGFWAKEYELNGRIADYPKPFVAWMDGVVMGGGVGVASHGSRRLVTERSKVAMPETVIGFFPDVGGLYLLSRAPGELGTHAALTGGTFSGADAVVLGLADEVVPSVDKERVLADLAADLATEIAADGADTRPGGPPVEASSGVPDGATISDGATATGGATISGGATATGDATVSGGATATGDATVSELVQQRDWIDACYAGDDAVVILERLRTHDDPAARAAGEAIAARSPLSVVVTLEAIRRARSMSVHEVLEQDARLGRTFSRHPDFTEGVRALLVDKDNAPRWADASVAEVDPAVVRAAFDG